MRLFFDADQDGIGDACEGEGLQGGGEMLLMGESLLGEEIIDLPVPEQGAIAYFVVHGGADSSISLPAGGGTVVVDLIVAAAEPLQSWDVLPASDAAGAIAIDAAGWTPEAELLAWAYGAFGVGEFPPAPLPSHYNCGLLDWDIRDAQFHVICRSIVNDAACVGRALEPGARTWTGMPGLETAAGPMDVPLDGFFAARAPLGAIASGRIGPGAERVVTLTLNVAAIPGTHKLWIAYGGYQSTADGEAAFMEPGPTFEIRVGSE